ncbi:MAG TPA: hypothetical protein PL045_04725 [Chitinophagaceae bacterium]|nr:hypothetical protein [Chitinophagaceae bacterium]
MKNYFHEMRLVRKASAIEHKAQRIQKRSKRNLRRIAPVTDGYALMPDHFIQLFMPLS